jgi:opacity protein-like surface antigen
MMKKLLFAAIAVFAFGFTNAQETKFGVRAGLDLLSAKFDGGGSVSATGFYVGGFADIGIDDKFSIQPGLNYHAASKDGVDFNYISIPVLAKYNVAENFNLYAGPSMYYSLESDDDDKTRFNLDLGVSYDITENLFVDPRYSLGLTGDVKVSHFLVGIGYKF